MASILFNIPRAFARGPVASLNSSRSIPFMRFLSQRPIPPRVSQQTKSAGGNPPQPDPPQENKQFSVGNCEKCPKYAAGALLFFVVFWMSNKAKYRVPRSEFSKDFDIPHTEETPTLSQLPRYRT
ncbi:unnamed protein product [Fusarium graminearum]|uniref:Chromosome 4, complete genome n=1 Tax=Gibberella zeae (strain ATCC MYA-4620 / CBS 123657 / FGSC 9075 / NRRL 31084 / PH-1) TaxID=229533 RepID=I1S8G1_GIBZE|nr:hypothetical protein FGSG_13139 [Fusarium graminearum PH-1]ESU13630.1 hypothetical protein FGSG_13139 [Fusarium graminearum PH-1]EYB27597.1 hypothetical protein FG05_13139 [Fusarium graminearum]CEF84386.1 unnamed protein product [Fusarium graminearum]CZS73245.1 unnamed protein product [Fusarium graminearum]|eukprot:XP_011327137.1 hypothetical protein FGSG_13139 [Fusarium graminearum PH-1]